MLESIKKLRDYTIRSDGSFWPPEIGEFIDEIEREIPERYMPLPVDADGVPWNLTDKEFIDPQGNNKGLRQIIFNIATERWELLGSDSYVSVASKCRHVKPRTVEDVLREFVHECCSNGELPACGNPVYSEYADRLRDLLGGDAS